MNYLSLTELRSNLIYFIHKCTKQNIHFSGPNTKRSERIFCDASKHPLHALGLKELSIRINVQSIGWIKVVLESTVSYLNLWKIRICGSGTLFGMAGSYNDINVLQNSPMFAKLSEHHAPECNYEISGHQYTKSTT